MENKSSTSVGVLRVLVVGGIIAILVFLSIGLVRLIPRAMNALASASVSITSLFKGNNATSTASTGFTISTSSPAQTGDKTSSSSISILDIIRPNATSTHQTTSTGSNTVTGTTNYTSSYPSTGVTGTPDLAVTITSRGVIDRTSGQFIETNNFTTSDTVIVKFKVENRGSGPTGAWNLRVIMPSSNTADQVRDINGNGSLPAGAAVTGQATFDSPTAGTNTIFSIAAATASSIREVSDANNIATTYFNVSGYNNGYPYNGSTGYQATLTGQMIGVGILDQYNNFVPTTNIHSYDRVAVQFRVTNTGSTATGPWSFQFNMGNGQTFSSNEASLAGNSSMTYTVGLQNVQQGYNSVNIYLYGSNVYNGNYNNTLSTSFYASY